MFKHQIDEIDQKILSFLVKNAIKINVANTPPPNKYKSNGLNHPSINLPRFVLAGIKY